ncbi:gephyrin-like molybdotransferase Glp [Roseovarius autotrophicus]|uniref:molybdopterin molybdotransferase MoeA n=1 Tax=Roseovarius autotrophicus TaxID=2824121 RepID=UPI0019F86A9D|nr:gephyrin-like molybdotransferase Glp [Roseovarius autotrophicus]MBE0454002.1 molybdopterin molybdotransferase MoeA [Roseovarius sp.]
MISVGEALAALFALVDPLEVEEVPLSEAAGRVLARDVAAGRDQPPFAASAMDGYAVADTLSPGAVLRVIGEAAAGHGFGAAVGPGEAVRIFTGAPVPEGATRVVMQEDVTRDGDRITLGDNIGASDNIRPVGGDFHMGEVIPAPRRLRPADLALLASMNIARVPVHRRPEVALIATGDELVMPGETPGPDQIVASNGFGLKALFESHGAVARLLPIARDTRASLEAVLGLAEGNDLIVTIGGASVGDHDLVARLGSELGMARAFYKVAMRPGKPLMAGRMGGAAMVGLPGNPVSAMVCGQVFVVPMLSRMQGLGAVPAPRLTARLAAPLPGNGPREHYMRARLGPEGITAEDRQDSSLLSILAHADALLVRPPHDPAREVGELVDYLPI